MLSRGRKYSHISRDKEAGAIPGVQLLQKRPRCGGNNVRSRHALEHETNHRGFIEGVRVGRSKGQGVKTSGGERGNVGVSANEKSKAPFAQYHTRIARVRTSFGGTTQHPRSSSWHAVLIV